MRQALDESKCDRIGDGGEHNRNTATLPLEYRDSYRTVGQDHICFQVHQFRRVGLHWPDTSARVRPPLVKLDIFSLDPAQSSYLLLESPNVRLCIGIAIGKCHQYADTPHLLVL